MTLGSSIPPERFLDCVHCGLCLQACPTYLETGDENDSPRGRIYLMRAAAEGRLQPNQNMIGHLDACLACRACESACPSGVAYARILEPFRLEWSARNGGPSKSGSRWAHWFLDKVLPYPDRLRFWLLPLRLLQRVSFGQLPAKAARFRFLPRAWRRLLAQAPPRQAGAEALSETLPAKGVRKGKVGLFLGCAAEVFYANTNRACARILQNLGYEVVVPKEQGCCGALAYHRSQPQRAAEFLRANTDAFADPEIEAVIVNAAGCGAFLKEAGEWISEASPNDSSLQARVQALAAKTQDFCAFVAEQSLPKFPGTLPMKVVFDAPCHQLHAQGIEQAPLRLLQSIPGLKVLPLKESDLCCGAAGSYSLDQPQMSERLGRRKAENILESSAEAVVTANVGCILQIQAALNLLGSDLPVYHLADVLDQGWQNTGTLRGDATYPCPRG